MADSFGTIGFTVLQAGMGRRQAAEVSVQHIPYSNINYIDSGGAAPVELAYQMLMTAGVYTLLQAQIGSAGTLTSSLDGTISSVLLTSMERRYRVPDSGTILAAGNFLIVTP